MTDRERKYHEQKSHTAGYYCALLLLLSCFAGIVIGATIVALDGTNAADILVTITAYTALIVSIIIAFLFLKFLHHRLRVEDRTFWELVAFATGKVLGGD